MPKDLLQMALELTEKGRVPDMLVREGIRRLSGRGTRKLFENDCEGEQQARQAFIEECRQSPIAPVPEKANEQHYEVPAEFFSLVLGKHKKYSCCWWPEGTSSLDEAEARALEETCRRARLEDGQNILELGCGWGSLTLWMAEHYPGSSITAVSNSASQRQYIETVAESRNLNNLKVITCDMNDFETAAEQYDRVVSIEMFEHMRNYEELMKRIARWLKPGGKLFVHIFCHYRIPYTFDGGGSDNWIGKYFFSGGVMPSADLLLYFQVDLALERHWRWSGEHYKKTANAWLDKLDKNRQAVRPIFENVYGPGQADKWIQRWRVFFMTCAEMFGYRNGQEWPVGHYLFRK
jgi:cyclopropane-fatty-acyl-phospholipid synthase